MGTIAPKKGEKHRVVIEVKGPMAQKAFKAYKKELAAVIRRYKARAASREFVEEPQRRIKGAL